MNLLLIAPSSSPWRHCGRSRWFGGRTFRFSMLSLLTVAAETPPDVTVRIIDEQLDEIPWDDPIDLVGITCMTALAPRAYEIAAGFRRRGVPVVLGGFHPTLAPEEAAGHADAIVAGEAEGVWPRVVEDAKAGRLGGIYRAELPPDLSRLRPPPRRLLDGRRYATLYAVQATRGCPNRCAFCSIAAFHGGRQRRRPVADVAREVAAIPSRWFVFVDDNLTADPRYARELFDALAPMRRHWATQASLEVAEDRDLVAAAAAAGCVGLFVGMETFSEANLRSVNKTCNRARRYRHQVGVLHEHGIGVEAGIVFGFDHDGPGVFESTLGMLDELGIDMAQVSALTPLPGTPQFVDLAPRIRDLDWAHYDLHHVVFEPRGMTASQLQSGHDWVTREFYRPWRIARRAARRTLWARAAATHTHGLGLDLAYAGRIRRWGIQGRNPVAPCETSPAREEPRADGCAAAVR